jgi:hypothetical protein
MAKPKLIPLKQWYCDTCDELIERPEDGWLEWMVDGNHRAYGYRICHHFVASPIAKEAGGVFGSQSCYKYNEAGHRDNHLHKFLGTDGMIPLLSEIHVGPVLDPRGTQPTEVKDFSGWAHTFRRLHIPYYEEASRYFSRAEQDGFFEGANEVWCFVQDTLVTVIEKYGGKE